MRYSKRMVASTEPELCIITPRLPPSMDGLGDHSFQLWKNRTKSGPSLAKWNFLVAFDQQDSAVYLPGVDIYQFEPSESGFLCSLSQINCSTLLLQYVGYGYDHAGQPFWLPRVLSKWRAAGDGRRLIVMFHETWASGKPWQRAFWQSYAQKQCTAQILKLADHAVTSCGATARDLQALKTNKLINIIPLGSSFTVEAKPKKNWRHCLIFGKSASRTRALRVHAALIRDLAQNKLIERLVLAGEASENDQCLMLASAWNLPIEITCAYNFAGDDLPESMLDCGLSLMHTESTCLDKSTSFHLAAALGQLVITWQETDPGAPLVCGEHYLAYKPQTISDIVSTLHNGERLINIADNLKKLGETYFSWPIIASQWQRLILSSIK